MKNPVCVKSFIWNKIILEFRFAGSLLSDDVILLNGCNVLNIHEL